MQCTCQERPQVLHIKDDQPEVPWPNLRRLATTNWKTLFVCTQCEMLWATDIADKYQVRLAMKVATIDGWDTESTDLRKEFLLQSHGGLGTAPCGWIGCENIQVKGSAYCVDHLFATGARD
jgi:hypothetical protein